MHNLFLGSAKYFLKNILVGQKIINETNFVVIQERVDSLVVPSDIGRIPHKILSGFASFTADQWKNWVWLGVCHTKHAFTLPFEIVYCRLWTSSRVLVLCV